MAGSSDNKFISHDGPDTNGIRAEVYVQKGTGMIVSMKPGATNVTAQVAVKNENPKVKFPIMGWVPVNDPIYPLIQEAFDAQTPIEYRLESQRKNSEPRDTPIAPLRETMDLAREHTTPIFAGINGQLSSEAVTNPLEDPAPGGRIRAVDTPSAPAAPAATTSQPPSQTQYSQSNRSATGEPPFRETNSDGSLNYDSYAIQAAVGAESIVRRLLADRDASSDTVAHYAIIILAIADTVQSYATNKKPSRLVNSHARIRGVVYDTVENFFPIPVSHDLDLDWVTNVGTLSRERFAVVERIASTSFDFASLKSNPNLANAQQATQDSDSVTPIESAPIESATGQLTAAPEQGDLSALSILGGNSEKAFEIYPEQDISALGNDPKVSPETMKSFKDWVAENGFDLTAIFKLLRYTFGAGHVASLPEASFAPFLDFYVDLGEENFSKVLDYAETISG